MSNTEKLWVTIDFVYNRRDGKKIAAAFLCAAAIFLLFIFLLFIFQLLDLIAQAEIQLIIISCRVPVSIGFSVLIL